MHPRSGTAGLLPHAARILAALRVPIPLNSVRVLPDDSTRAVMSTAALVPAAECTDLSDQVGGQAAQCLGGGFARSDLAQDVGGAVGGQPSAGAGRGEVGEQHVEPVDGLGVRF